jgi:hypothetical protein
MVAQPLQEITTLTIWFSCTKWLKSVVHFPRLWQFAEWLCDHWHITAVPAHYANELEAEVFTLMRALLYGPVALKRAIFKRKKGSRPLL